MVRALSFLGQRVAAVDRERSRGSMRLRTEKGGQALLTLSILVFSVAPGERGVAQSTGGLQGRVVTADGTVVDDATVRVMALGRRLAVDDSGDFSFQNLPSGSYLVEAVSPRFGQAVERFRVMGGQTVSVLLELDPLFQLDELVVSAGPAPARRSETYQPTSALTGWDLVRDAEASLGETLAEAPGVTASYNGPGSSRPIIRGLGGDRVRILEAGVGSGDVSSQGPDHAVGIEPLAAERIEVVRGPATLLYGSGVMGGVVNVIDRRIPRELPLRSLTGSAMGLGGTVADERTVAVELNGGVGSWAVHASGLKRKTGDYAIPGFAEHQHDGESPPAEGGDEAFGVLPNSAIETARGALGLSWIGDAGYFGAAVSGLDNDYGVPGHAHGHEEEPGAEEEEEGVLIGLEQRRFDAEGTWRFPEGFLRALQGRFGYTDYQHTEFEGTAVGTRFYNRQWEGRLEVDHNLFELLNGSVGGQLGGRAFEAQGEEAYVPPSETSEFGLFLFQELEQESLRFQVGGRMEIQRAREKPTGLEKDDVGFSLSGGLNWAVTDRLSLALTGARSQRLPSLEELFADGPHAATFAYEIGDSDLEPETAHSIDATLHLTGGLIRVEATTFLNLFDGFIYQEYTGGEVEGLPVLQTVQGDAAFLGGEGSVEFDLIHRGSHHLLIEGWGDYVRAELRATDEPLPRIPPLRFGSRLRYNGGTIRADLGVTTVSAQDRTAPFEEETDGYSMLDLSLGYRLFTGAVTHDIVLRGSNLTDREARSHTSFLKEMAPLPGREIRFMYRVHF
jgi:iron complex outermembrane receptor protein